MLEYRTAIYLILSALRKWLLFLTKNVFILTLFGSLFIPLPLSLPSFCVGADPKSVLCVFFKQGLCSKGSKCKFSHDLSLEGKAEKRSMYVDKRELEEGTRERARETEGGKRVQVVWWLFRVDTMDKWDDEKLHDVVDKKHGGKTKPKTEIVS